MKNLKEFEDLILRYRGIKLLEINIYKKNCSNFLEAKNKLTGFGNRSTCSLCKSIANDCQKCCYLTFSTYHCSSSTNYSSYSRILFCETAEELLKAYNNRADRMEYLLRIGLKKFLTEAEYKEKEREYIERGIFKTFST